MFVLKENDAAAALKPNTASFIGGVIRDEICGIVSEGTVDVSGRITVSGPADRLTMNKTR